MSPFIRLSVGLIISTFIYPLGIFILFTCVLGVISLHEWYLTSWNGGMHVFRVFVKTIFSWHAIKFYLLAWGVGIVMVCSLTYQNFKPEIQENSDSPWRWLITLGNLRRRYINSFARAWMRALRPKRKSKNTQQ